jgi:hypothetical protein
MAPRSKRRTAAMASEKTFIPESSRLKVAWLSLERGDAYLARKLAASLLEKPEAEQEREGARAIIERTKVPSTAVVIAVGVTTLIVGMIFIGLRFS